MQNKWTVLLVMMLPTAFVSRAWGRIVRWRRPRWLVDLLKKNFVRVTGIDLGEAEQPLEAYACLEDLFVRRLRVGARTIDARTDAVVSPVDGMIGELGTVEQGTLLQVKGCPYELAALLGDDSAAARMERGTYVTIYLAPHNYHRIHAPLGAAIREAVYLPGRLLPVFRAATAMIPGLFVRNERIVTYFELAHGKRAALVKVGATLVGRMTVTYDDALRTNARRWRKRQRRRYDPAVRVVKGDELGAFELGSTVVFVAERGALTLDACAPGTAVRVGERIGTLRGSDAHA
ncbi:MAG: archaetidylserine decarboxylase [Myxococcota bacterium]